MTVVPFRKPAPEVQHWNGECVCGACRHRWQGVAPLGTLQLECPSCLRMLGRPVWEFSRGTAKVWCCTNCSSTLWTLAENGAYCAGCGFYSDDHDIPGLPSEPTATLVDHPI